MAEDFGGVSAAVPGFCASSMAALDAFFDGASTTDQLLNPDGEALADRDGMATRYAQPTRQSSGTLSRAPATRGVRNARRAVMRPVTLDIAPAGSAS